MNNQPSRLEMLVLISEDKVSRGKWPMGRVDKLASWKRWPDSYRYLEDEERASKETCSEITSRLEASSTKFVTGEFVDSGAYGGESATCTRKGQEEGEEETSYAQTSVKSPTALERWGGCSGQDPLWKNVTTPCETKLVMWPPYWGHLLC